MNESVSAFPDPPEDIFKSPEMKDRADPASREHDREEAHDEIEAKDDAKVQVMRHKFSFFRNDNSGRLSIT